MPDATDEAREGLSSVTRGTLLMLLGTLGYVAENFVARVLLVRALPADEWGVFSLGLALVGVLTTLGALGIPQAVARSLSFASADPERRTIVRSSFAVVGPVSIGLTVGLFAYGARLADQGAQLGLTLELFALSIAFSVVAGLIASVFQGYEDVLPNALFQQVVNPSLFIVFMVGATALSVARALSFTAALLAYLSASACTLAALVVYGRWRLPRLLPRGPRQAGVSRRLFLFAAPLFVVGIAGILAQNGDTLLLGVFHLATVGFYTAPLSLGRLVLVGLGSLSYIFLPVATRFVRERNPTAIRVTYVTATKWMVLTSLPLFLLFFFYPGPSLAFVYGSPYIASALPLRILVLGAFLTTLLGPSTATQVAFGQTRLLMYNTIAAGGIDLALGVLLIPPFGNVGAAAAWACASVISPALSAIQLAYLEGVHPFHSHYLRPVVATGLPVGIVLAAVPTGVPYWGLPLVVLAIALLYVVAVVGTRSIDTGDRLLLEVVESFLGRRLPLVRRLSRWAGMRPPRA